MFHKDEAKRVERIKEKYGKDFYRRAGAIGGKRSTRGYFGYLKDTDPEGFKKFQKNASLKGAAATKAKQKNHSK